MMTMLPDCNNSPTTSSSYSLHASLSARRGARAPQPGAATRREQEGLPQLPTLRGHPPRHDRSSSTAPTASPPTITATTARQLGGVAVNHGNPSLADASILQRHVFLPTRTNPTPSFNFGSRTSTTRTITRRSNVLRHDPHQRHQPPLRTAMTTCRHEIRGRRNECIVGIIEHALLIVESMDDDYGDDDDDQWMLNEHIPRF